MFHADFRKLSALICEKKTKNQHDKFLTTNWQQAI